MGRLLVTDRTKTILYWVAIGVFAALFIAFLAAFIVERNANAPSKSTAPTTLDPSSTTVPSTTSSPINRDDLRLDNSVLPSRYVLDIVSDHENDLFNGSVTIDIAVTSVDNLLQVRLHCKSLKIDKYLLKDSTGKTVDILNVEIDDQTELCKFNLKNAITKGDYVFAINYSGQFKEGQITGFYKSPYTTLDNQVRYLTATKFEPTYARMAFPCFDEPTFKSIFDISITHPSSHNAISNEMETSMVLLDNGWSKTSFKKTVPMSTYLVAFVVSDFKYTETKTTFGTRVRVYSRPDQVEKTRYALEAAAKVLRFYENYTQIDYTLSKLDLIGLPEFVSGAMENWGLVTYKETYVLYSETESSLDDMRRIAAVVSHELTHMWFGNLVTMKWWNDLWLNEGFASFIEYKAQHLINQTWNIFDRFLPSDLYPAFRADSLKSAHPIVSKDIVTPNEITSLFDTITYSKGASILYMLENVIGEDAFRNNSGRYLAENKFGNTDTAMMLQYFKDDIKKVTDVEGDLFMRKWVEENGYPVLSVERTNSDNQLKLTQLVYSSSQPVPLDNNWYIYVSYLTTSNREGKFVMNKAEQTVDLLPISSDEWFKLNRGGTGYYLVNYQPNDWKLLIQELKLKSASLKNTDRSNLIFDAYQLTEKSLLSYETLFDLFDYLPNEDNYLPWSAAYSSINSLLSKMGMANGVSYLKFNLYIRDLVSTAYDSLVDISADSRTLSSDQISLQNNLIALACEVEYDKCIDSCSHLFRRWLDDGVVVRPDIRSYVYSNGLKASTLDTDWLRVWDLYVSQKDALEKSKLMTALTKTKSSTLLSLLISYSHNQSIINNENFFSVQQNIASNSDIGRGLVWDYIKNNWDSLVERFTLNDRRFGNYVNAVARGFGTKSRLAEIETFFATHPAGAGGSRDLVLETVRSNINWVEKNEASIAESVIKRDQYSKPWLNWRLDESVRPEHYDLSLSIDLDNETFHGSVKIVVNVKKPIRYLIIHSKDLDISSSSVATQTTGTVVSDGDRSFAHTGNQFWIIPMTQIILPGSYVAQLTFNGTLNSALNGLYLSRYVRSQTNEVVKLATTQFEATYARGAFPCFDEPGFKATYTVSITHESKYIALSNMPVDYFRDNGPDQTTTVFKKSVKMNTYPMAFVVSDFVSKKSTNSSIDFSVYTYNPDINLKNVDYSLNVGPRILNFYEKYFNIPYPLPKLDMISIPDFSMGAMENWGLVTYRDVYILYDKAESTLSSKMTVCSIVAHELAHMWFGNLVTIKWWDDLWLNEGFAQFMQYKATSNVEPSWNYEQYFVLDELSRVFDTDSSQHTHSILTMVKNENDIQAVFDPVTYAKGASVIRMLENTMGEAKFRTGVSNYLKKYSFNNTLTADLWGELSLVNTENFNLTEFMDPWIRKEGFPVVTVSTSSNNFTFEQERFLKDFSKSNASYYWFIPLTYQLIDDKNPELTSNVERIYFNSKKMNVQIDQSNNKLVKFNVDQTGVYVVNYPVESWNKWADLLNTKDSIAWKKLSVLDRNSLLSDAFYLSRSGRLSYEVTLKLAQFLKYERSYTVWQTASNMLSYLRTFAISQDGGISYNQWIRNELVGSLYEELGWEANESDDIDTQKLRPLILNLACHSDHELCLKTANEKFDQFTDQINQPGDKVKPDPDTFSIFLNHAMRSVTDDRTKFDLLLSQYKDAATTNEKMRFLRALTSVRSEKLLTELLDQSLDPTFLRSQDFFSFLLYLSYNPVGLGLGWNFYRNNYPAIVERYGLVDSNIGRTIFRFAVYFNTQSRRKEVADLYSKYPQGGAGQLYREKALELVEANVAWSNKFYGNVIEYLTKKCDSSICPWGVYRLNDNVKPYLYDFTIQVDTNSFLYNGTARSYVTVGEPVSYIVMHAASTLNVHSPNVQLVTSTTGKKNKRTISRQLATGNGFRYSPLDFYVIPLSSPIPANQNVSIEVSFNSTLLAAKEVGLYRGWYESENGTVNLAATQFESTHARKVFPCFDEPHFKPEMDITIVRNVAMNTTFTNMPIELEGSVENRPDLVATKYQRTVPMVTYLIAILVSDFHCSSSKVEGLGEYGSLDMQVCASSEFKLEKHDYALNLTAKIIGHFETLLGVKYKLPKLDQIALPQFSPGAMENWGLVKYREKFLLWTEDEETAAEQRSVCSIMSHELAHMWFGNLVTCDFWGHLWLNEAFASYMEFSSVASAHPDWNYFDMFVYYDTFNALWSDSEWEASQPIVRNVTAPSLMSYTSNIVYSKGSAILNMLNSTMGNDKFVAALNKYLVKYSFQSAVSTNLFLELENEWPHTDLNLTTFMNSWTMQPGFPYLNITHNPEDNTYSYVQERYLQSGTKPVNDTLYSIPFSYYYENSKTKSLEKSELQFLTEKSGKLDVDFSKVIKINPNFNGFYLVNYPADFWNRLSERLRTEPNLVNSLTVNDRSELLITVCMLTRAKLMPYLTAFKMFNYLVHEKHFVPWYYFQFSFDYLAYNRIARTKYRESVLQFYRRLSNPHYTGLEFWDDSIGTNVEKNFRQNLIKTACQNENQQCLEDAYQKFTLWIESDGDIKLLPPNLRSNILNYGIKYSNNKSHYDFVWDKYKAEKTTSRMKPIYLEAITFISNSEILQEYVDQSLDERIVPQASFVTFFVSIIDKFEQETMTWNYFTSNYLMLSSKLTSTMMHTILDKFATVASTPTRRSEIKTFLDKYPNVGVSEYSRSYAMSRIDQYLNWTHETEIGEWLSQNACGDLEPKACSWSELRISADIVVPIKYDLLIQVNLTTNIYNGSVGILVNAVNPFKTIALNAADMLSVDLIAVRAAGKPDDIKCRMFRYKPNQYVVIEFEQEQPKGQYELSFKFSANMLEAGLSGLYLSNYNVSGESNKIASTQFEFYDARKVFPCFDEPAMKATFKVTIIHDQKMNTTLSNIEIENETLIPKSGLVETRFKESPIMTTYLVAMLVSDFVCVEKTGLNEVRYGVCAARNQQHKMSYALEKAPICLNHLESVLKFQYPLKKVHLLAIPDFYYGAMENWGLITFRESGLLYNELDTTSSSKIQIISVIAHELAHFWFGNLVTCEWWDNIWLNEAFATYMEYTTVNAAEPNWNFDETFLYSDYLTAVSADSSDTAHPVVRSISKTKDIDQYNSNIIYSKGGTLLRMVEFIMGKENFYKSLANYLETNKYKSAKAETLLTQFDQHFESPDPTKVSKITDFMDEWIHQKGFPYLNVSKVGNGYRIVQNRFLLRTSSNSNSTLNTLWKVPISYYTDNSWTEKKIQFLTKVEDTFMEIPTDGLVKFNTEHRGFFLVNYSSDIWNSWIEALVVNYSTTKLPAVDRAGLLLDSFQLASANLLSYNVPLKLSRYLVNEDHVTPWRVAITALNKLRNTIIVGSKYGKEFKSYVGELVSPLYEKLGWDDTDGNDIKRALRSWIIDFACANDHQDCLSSASRLFSQWKVAKQTNDPTKIPMPNLLSPVLEYGLIVNATSADWLFVWSQYLSETSATLKPLYIRGLANGQDQSLITMLLTQALEAKVIRTQDVSTVFSAVANSRNQTNVETLWQFFKTNYVQLTGPDSPLRLTQVSSILNTICRNYFFTSARKTELQTFFTKFVSVGLSNEQRIAAISLVDANIASLTTGIKEIENYLLCGESFCQFNQFRLTPNIQPLKYNLEITVDLENDKFSGNVQIETVVSETNPISYINLHAASSLTVIPENTTVYDQTSKQSLDIKRQFAFGAYDFWVIELEKPIAAGEIRFEFHFNSNLSTDMLGFYRSEYYDQTTGKMVKLASTQFQDTYARRAFPCFDEPSFKSVFEVTLKYDQKYNATLSNTKVVSNDQTDDGFVVTKFEPTPKMVTYLLAFIVSDFYCGSNDNETVTVQVCSSPPEAPKTEFSLSKAPQVIQIFENKLGYPYMLNKMDLVAIPDFSAGAMENWGLLTFRETALLWHQTESSASDKMYVMSVVAHEIAHMWFGNLVTCHWWADLWLNEAFASYLETVVIVEAEPDWQYDQLFYSADFITGMVADASLTAHPLVRTVNTPSEINYISNIIYQKGASILRMFDFVLGPEGFFPKLQEYLNENKYTTTVSSVLIDKLGEASVSELTNSTTTEFLQSWTLKAGFPYLNVEKSTDNTYTIVQNRYLSDTQATDPDKKTWIVPLSFYTNYQTSNEYKIVFLQDRNESISIEVNSELPPKFNYDARGFYIVNYPREDWERWAKLFSDPEKLQTLKLTSQDYSNILYDAFSLSKVNYLPYSHAFELTRLLKHNRMLSVWLTTANIFGQLWPYLQTSETSGISYLIQNSYRKYAQSLVQDRYQEFSLQSGEPQSLIEQRLRSSVVAFACAYGYDQCLLEAQVEFKKWRSGQTISPNVITTVLRYAIQESSDTSDWHYLWERYVNTSTTSIKLSYLEGLAQSSNLDLLNLLFERANDPTLIRRQNYLSLYSYSVRTPTGFQFAWNYFKTNYKMIGAKHVSGSGMGKIAGYFARYVYTEAQKTEFEQFFTDHADIGISSTDLRKALETVSQNIRWSSSYRQQVYDWLKVANAEPKSSRIIIRHQEL